MTVSHVNSGVPSCQNKTNHLDLKLDGDQNQYLDNIYLETIGNGVSLEYPSLLLHCNRLVSFKK